MSPPRADRPVSARSPIDSVVATTKGDDGTTGLLYGGARIGKDDPRTEAYGTVDEAIAALGLARANLGVKRRIGTLPAGLGGLAALILRFQRELFVVGAELATNPDAWDRLEDGRTRVSEAMVRDVERDLVELEAHIEMPREFVVPGETPTSAALELARTILRRAERRAVALQPRRPRARAEPHPLPQPPRRPRVGLGARRRTCRIARSDPGPAAGRRNSKGEHNVTFQNNPGGRALGQPADGSARAASTSAATSQVQGAFLTQAFFWMFAGLLADGGRRRVRPVQHGAARLRGRELPRPVHRASSRSSIVIRSGIRRLNATARARPVLRLRGEPRAHDRADRLAVHRRVGRHGVPVRRARCSAAPRCTATPRSARSRASAAIASMGVLRPDRGDRRQRLPRQRAARLHHLGRRAS